MSVLRCFAYQALILYGFSFCKPTFIPDIISRFTGNKLVFNDSILRIRFVLVLKPYGKDYGDEFFRRTA